MPTNIGGLILILLAQTWGHRSYLIGARGRELSAIIYRIAIRVKIVVIMNVKGWSPKPFHKTNLQMKFRLTLAEALSQREYALDFLSYSEYKIPQMCIESHSIFGSKCRIAHSDGLSNLFQITPSPPLCVAIESTSISLNSVFALQGYEYCDVYFKELDESLNREKFDKKTWFESFSSSKKRNHRQKHVIKMAKGKEG